MRTLVCVSLVAVVFFAVSDGSALADGTPVARMDQVQVQGATLEAAAGAGAALAPRLTFQPATPISFGFQGPKVAARLAPPRPVVAPSAFHGFGGFAARVRVDDLRGERPLVQVNDVVEERDVVVEEDVVEGEVLEGHVDECGRVYTTRRPSEVTHQSSYYVPRYRTYYRSCGSCCSPCYRSCYRSCYRPCYRTYYVARPCYSTCYRPCGYGYGCGAGPFWNGLGWGLGVGLGVGIIAGW